MAATISRPRIGSDQRRDGADPSPQQSAKLDVSSSAKLVREAVRLGVVQIKPDGQIVRPGFRTDFGRAPRAPGAAAGSGDLTAAARVFSFVSPRAAAHDGSGMTERKPNPPRAGRENRPRARRPRGPEVHAPDGSSARPLAAGLRLHGRQIRIGRGVFSPTRSGASRVSRASRRIWRPARRLGGEAALPGLVNVHSHAFPAFCAAALRRAAARGRIATIARWPR